MAKYSVIVNITGAQTVEVEAEHPGEAINLARAEVVETLVAVQASHPELHDLGIDQVLRPEVMPAKEEPHAQV